jgi:hypothetical protein
MSLQRQGAVFLFVLLLLVGGSFLVSFPSFEWDVEVSKNSTSVEECHHNETTDICHSLQRYSISISNGKIPTPVHLWLHHKSDIIQNTLQQEFQQADTDQMKVREIQSWAEWLFALSTPERMQRALHSFVPREALASILGILQKRIENLDTERPLRILVIGGSVPAGTSCSKSPFEFLPNHDGPRVRHRCVWPSRLGAFLNQGAPLFELDNMALGGTTSDMGALAIQYRLWEKEPDIIIASFAANDYRLEVQAAFRNMQQLVRASNTQRNCTSQLPLLVYLDDFFGWPSTSVQEQLDMHSSLKKLCEWNQFLVLSYVDVFSDYVMANVEHDSVFKGPWHPRPDPHGGRSFHITATWLFLYSFLQFAFDFCTQPPALTAKQGNAKYAVGNIPQGPRPLLDDKLQFDQVGDLWRQNADCAENKIRTECDFLWIANRIGRNAARFRGDVMKILEPKLVKFAGWREGGDATKNKHGWEAFESNATFILSWTLAEDVSDISIVSMQSYGDKWANSKLRMTVNQDSSFEWLGYHGDETSVSLPFEFHLNETISKGDTISVEFRLIGGSSFKISGMMFCAG